jgi:hypothetical protein
MVRGLCGHLDHLLIAVRVLLCPAVRAEEEQYLAPHASCPLHCAVAAMVALYLAAH